VGHKKQLDENLPRLNIAKKGRNVLKRGETQGQSEKEASAGHCKGVCPAGPKRVRKEGRTRCGGGQETTRKLARAPLAKVKGEMKGRGKSRQEKLEVQATCALQVPSRVKRKSLGEYRKGSK